MDCKRELTFILQIQMLLYLVKWKKKMDFYKFLKRRMTKPTKGAARLAKTDLRAQRRLKSAWVSALFDLSPRSAFFFSVSLRPKGSTDWQRSLWLHCLIWVIAVRTGHFVGSMVLWLYWLRLVCYGICFSRKSLTSCRIPRDKINVKSTRYHTPQP